MKIIISLIIKKKKKTLIILIHVGTVNCTTHAPMYKFTTVKSHIYYIKSIYLYTGFLICIPNNNAKIGMGPRNHMVLISVRTHVNANNQLKAI